MLATKNKCRGRSRKFGKIRLKPAVLEGGAGEGSGGGGGVAENGICATRDGVFS